MASPFPRTGRPQPRGGDVRKPVRKPKRVPGKDYVDLGGGRFRNVKEGSARRGKTFKIGRGGAHIYSIDGREVRIGGAKPGRGAPAKKQRPANTRAPKPGAYDPMAPLTGRAFEQEVEAQTNLQYRPRFQEIDRQTQESTRHEAGMGDWYNRVYIPALEAASAKQQAAYQGAQASQQQAAAGLYEGDAARQAQMRAQAEQSAAARGTTVDEKVYADMANAASVRREGGNAQAGLIGAIGANQAAYGAQQVPIARSQELGFRRGESDRRRQLSKTRSDLLAERGQAKIKNRSDLTTRERTYGMEREVLGIKQFDAKVDAADKAADNRRDRAKMKADRRDERQRRREAERKYEAGRDDEAWDRLDDQEKNRLAQERLNKTGSGGAGSLTPTQRRGYQADLGQAFSLAQAYMKGGKLKKGVTPEAVVAGLVGKKGYPRDLAKAAVQRAIHGGVDPALARRIKQKYGVTVKTRKKAKRPPAPTFIAPGDVEKVR